PAMKAVAGGAEEGGAAGEAAAGAVAGEAAAGLGALVPVIGAVVAGVEIARTALNAFKEALFSWTQLASPAQFKQFQIAIEDVKAVIGSALLPVLELFREGVRLVGDVLANIIPNFSEVRAAMSPLFDAFTELGNSIRELV